jgi:glycosyltransferase involved in cell wall biosynthesis
VEALYYEPRNTPQLVNHLQLLLSRPDRARALGAAARERVREFSVARMVRCFEDTVDVVLAARH